MQPRCRNWTMPSARSATNSAPNTCWPTIPPSVCRTHSSGAFKLPSRAQPSRPLITCDTGRGITRRSRISELYPTSVVGISLYLMRHTKHRRQQCFRGIILDFQTSNMVLWIAQFLKVRLCALPHRPTFRKCLIDKAMPDIPMSA